MTLIIMIAAFGIMYLSRSRALKSNELIGELVAPWNEISSIEYVNIRKKGIDEDAVIIADWEIHTRSGEIITIPNVKYSIAICNEIRKKFWPNC